MIIAPKILTLAFVVIIISAKYTPAQTCGFGCLGLGGFYAGYTFQNYETDSFNEGMLRLNPSADEFGTAKGFRLGANFFRTKYKGVLLTFKGYYQFLNEQNRVTNTLSDEPMTLLHSLDLNYWGIGFDAGLNLMKYVDLKALEAQVTFHKAKLTVQYQQDLPDSEEDIYRSGKTKVGVQLGSGFIFHLAGEYISLEMTAAYSIFSINQLEDENGNIYYAPGIENNSDQKFIDKGGLTLLAQLNIGIPIY